MPKTNATAPTAPTEIVATATNPDAPAPVTTVPPEVFAGLSLAGYDSETMDVRTVDLARQAGDTKEASAAYAAGRLGAAFAPQGTPKAQAIIYGADLLKLAGAGASDATAKEKGGKRTTEQENVYGLARAAWSKVLYRAGLRAKNAQATTANGLPVMTNAQVVKADKETAAEKASATAEKIALDTPKAGATYLATKGAELAVKIEKNPKAFTSGMRRAVLAFTTAIAAEMAKVDAAQ